MPPSPSLQAGGTLGGDGQRLLVGLGQQLVELLEARSSSSSGVRSARLRILERAGVGRRGEVVTSSWIVSPASSRRRPDGQRAPLVLVEVRTRRGLVEVLQRAAARLRAHELDAVVVAQHAYVVGDDAERSAKLHGEVARAGDALAEPLQDACAQRMSQRLRDPGLRGFPRRRCPYYRMGLMNWWAWSQPTLPVRALTSGIQDVNAPRRMVLTGRKRSRLKTVAENPVERPCVMGTPVFTICMPKRSASLTDPPKSDPCRPPART